MGGFVKAVLDPAGIFGNWEDTPGGPAPSAPPSQLAMDAGWAGMNPEKPSLWDNSNGFISGMTDFSKTPAATAAFGEGKANPKPFEAQWQFAAGKGPQWVEPKLENKQWSPNVTTGPVKGNRF